jgi:hypothetical protein
MLCCPLSLVTFFSNCAENLELDSVLRPSGASLYANEVVEVADQYGQVATQIEPAALTASSSKSLLPASKPRISSGRDS